MAADTNEASALRKRSLVLLLCSTAVAFGCRAGGSGLQTARPPLAEYHLGPNEWVTRAPGQSCTADAQRTAFGCTITRCTESGPADGGEGEYTQGFGRVRASCGETVEVCGRASKCECEICSEVPDYATRMSRNRRATRTRPDENGSVVFSVSYDDGQCEGVANPHYGEDKLCHVSAWDDSQVGGCHRNTNEPGSRTFFCGESVTVCGGVEVRCECLDGGVQQLSVSGAHRAVQAGCDAN